MKTLTIASPKNLNFYEKIIYTLKLFWFVFFISVASGMFPNMTEYLDEITYISHILVSLILIIVFNPIKPFRYRPYHGKMAFSTGLYVLLSTSLVEFLERSKKRYKTIKKDVIIPIKKDFQFVSKSFFKKMLI